MAKKVEFNLATVKKYVFWAFIPVALLLPLVTTTMAVGTITANFEKRKGELNNKKSSVEKIKSASDHPNQKTIDEINERTKELRGRVRKAWGILEKDQRERNLWPSEVGQDFLREIQTLKWGEEISLEGLEKYMTFAQKYLPALEIFVERRRVQYRDRDDENAKWGPWQEMDVTKDINSMMSARSAGGESGMGGSGGEGGMGMGMGGASFGSMDSMGSLEPPLPKDELREFRYHGKVDWPTPETRSVVSGWGALPKYTEIWYAQEELWVYKALLSVIRQSNIDATGPHNATIKKIENLLIGQAASSALEAQSKNRISAGPGAGAMSGSDMSSAAMDGGVGGGDMIARTEEDAERIKRERRYVDEKGTPLGAADKSKFDQFKRMPICLRLIVDQRKVPEILVNCANCSMPIDVLWVRINPGAAKPFELSALDATASSAGEGGGDSMAGSGGSDGAGYGGMEGGGRGGPGGGGTGIDEIQVRLDGVGGPYGTNAIPIEIYGCINIFNPVEQSTELASQPETEGESNESAEIKTEAPLQDAIKAEEEEEEKKEEEKEE